MKKVASPLALVAAASLLPGLVLAAPKRHRARAAAPTTVEPAAVAPAPVLAASVSPVAPIPAAPSPTGSVVVGVVNLNRRTQNRDVVVARPRWVDPMRPAVVGELAPELGMRDFRYGQATSAGLRSYSNPGIVMGSLRLEAYPLAPTSIKVLRDIGLAGSFGTSLPISSTSAHGASIDGSWTRYEFGARMRLRLNEPPNATWLYVDLTYGDSKFSFSGADPLAADAPSVEYKYGRAGGEVRVPIGKLSFLGGAGYRYVLSSGVLGQKFPRATTGGFDVRMGAAYRINMMLEARATAEYEAILTNTNALPGDRFIAGQALDQYAVFHVGVTALVF